ncbi:MAG TPA: protein-L-isoaspartate(D-aspartate) O-methyltransferase [Beijerinckiaceae bacterium]|jgi:protein-L-isoaspartate(D-aspartate) O-methyltransferase
MSANVRRWLALAIILSLPASAPAAEADFAAARDRMVETIAAIARTAAAQSGGAIDPAVLAAMRQVPRHELVPADLRHLAYTDSPLSIGFGQTISQPYIVALMTSLAKPAREHVVLEVGTGSGYQAAVLARLVAHVYSIEIVAPLAGRAAERLKALGYGNVTVRHGDGYKGWPEHAPFDVIVVTAAADHIPTPLVEQLKPGGRMVIPVGATSLTQHLMLVEKDREGRAHTRRAVLPVRFVPLTGGNR